MESSPITSDNQATANQSQPRQLELIFNNIDELMHATIAMNEAAAQQNPQAMNAGANSDQWRQSAQLFKDFKDLMVAVQSKAARAIRDTEAKLGLNTQPDNAVLDVPIEDLVGVSPEHELNRVLGRSMSLRGGRDGKQTFKLRDFDTGLPNTQLIVAGQGDAPAALPQNSGDAFVVLNSTLRNVWVIQHAYACLVKHKESLIKQYLDNVASSNSGVVSRKFSREYYEDLSLAQLPSKQKLGNLLDVQKSSYDCTTHHTMAVIAFMDSAGNRRYMEAVSGAAITIDENADNGCDCLYLRLPATEASIKKLYDTYRSLRAATSEQRRAVKDKALAATLPTNPMDELEKQFDFSVGGETEKANGGSSKKRRRMLDDDGPD
ncbi:uncharacterized protein GGS25DRAFT_506950 [Hypoxylon fragiforme]|uniref:uncharacterized protein n=1 Tax=Hypoxylon fragiforme TaxID=63214 RepID=UPI0020C6195E|nr:uncharacterized protein GGS25DRAFT_506950 [Hypoxylon fragiforme]KAI2604112.1 hypothetical protein GGS25DRAFT_506950 [Hypoxylon fragiforme]